jgi:hypothetical protein
MGVQNTEDGYTSNKSGREDHEGHKGHVVALEKILSHSCHIFIVVVDSWIEYGFAAISRFSVKV